MLSFSVYLKREEQTIAELDGAYFVHNKEIAALTFKNRNNDIATPVGEKLRSNWPARIGCQGGEQVNTRMICSATIMGWLQY